MKYEVSSDQIRSGIILNYDSMFVYSSGTAIDITVNSGGVLLPLYSCAVAAMRGASASRLCRTEHRHQYIFGRNQLGASGKKSVFNYAKQKEF